MKKIVSVNYFDVRVDLEGLNAYKETEEYANEVEAVNGDWAFAQLQDMLESRFTATVPVAESTDDDVAYDYYKLTDYALTLYVMDINGNNVPFMRFKFENSSLDQKLDRKLTDDEVELAKCIIEAEHLDIEVAA